MSLVPPTVADINDAIISNIETQIGDTIPILPVAFVRVLAKVLAGVIILLYKYGNFTFLNLFVSTASFQATTVNGTIVTPLIEWGRLVGAGDPVPAVAAELTATITVTNQTGDPIPIGTQLVYDPTGVVYLMTAAVLRDAATKVITIEAASDPAGGGGLGTIGNLEDGSLVSFANPIPDVVRDAVIASTVTSGEDAEPEAQYRQRVQDRFQKRPQGGALVDHEIWGEEAAGIINVYPYTGDIPGTTENYCEADTVSSGSPDGLPTAPQLQAALDSINLDVAGRATRRAANALALVFSITRRDFEVEVIGLDAPDPATTQTAITDGLETVFAGYEPFIGGVTVVPKDRITSAEIGGKVFEIAQANNATFSTVLVKAAINAEQLYSAFVGQSEDDASETAGTVTLAGAILALVPANTIGARFGSVNVPAGAEILSATLTFTSPSVKNVYSSVTVVGEATASGLAFTATANDITDRAQTVNFTTWVPDPWAVDEENSVDVAEIVTEVIGISGWAVSNAMVFILTSVAPSDREARSFDDDPAKAPKLDITYRAPDGAKEPITVLTLLKGEKAKVSSVSFP